MHVIQCYPQESVQKNADFHRSVILTSPCDSILLLNLKSRISCLWMGLGNNLYIILDVWEMVLNDTQN
jgi:hypothetical protein